MGLTAASPFALQLRHWRSRRRLSQLNLAGEAAVSSRHLSFLETGRARPSREMVLRLAEALDLPLRDRNDLLIAAGFAPAFAELPLDAPRMRSVREGLSFLLLRHEPYPAFVVDRVWNVQMGNAAYRRMLALLGAGEPGVAAEEPAGPPLNALRLVLAPGALRSSLANWQQVARVLMARLDHELRASQRAPELVALRDELTAITGVREAMATRLSAEEEGSLLVPMVLVVGEITLSWFSTIASFAAPLDVTLQEARIESLLPADEATRQFAQQVAEHEAS